jgi:DNA mismatch repair protein MutL
LTLRTRTREANAGSEIVVAGGSYGEIAPCGCPEGTSLEVENLFCNTPVRRKFLRTPQTEMGHAQEAFLRIALAHPQIHFTLRHGKRVLVDLPVVESWRQRIATAFGGEIAESLIRVHSDDGPIVLAGYVAHPDQSRSNNRMQYLFLNGRHIRDRALQHALGEAYRGLLLTGRYPICFLKLELPADQVDVNVHPSKLEVRFQDGGRLYSQLLGTLRSTFLSTDLTSKSPDRGELPEAETAASTAHSQHQATDVREQFVSWARGQQDATQVDTTPTQTKIDLAFDRPAAEGLTFTRLDREWQSPAPVVGGEQSPATGDIQALPTAEDRGIGLQIHNRYLVTENEDGVVIIDQHALHERILYELIRKNVLAGNMEIQQLLVPEPVHLTSQEAAAVLESQELLAQLGIRVEPFGGDTVVISSYPAMLAKLSPEEILRQAIEHLMAEGKKPERRDMLDELMHMMSCKAAIKAGDRLTSQEVTALLQQRHLVQDSHHCPHGRPTSLVFTSTELDRRFKRI